MYSVDLTLVGTTTYISLITNDVLMSQFLRTDDTTFDSTLVASLWASACEQVEIYTGLVMRPMTLTMYMDELPTNSIIKLPHHPITAITSVSTKVSSDSYTTVNSSTYTTDLTKNARIKFIDDPEYTGDYLNAIKVIATVGYATAAAIPQQLIGAALMLCGHLYNNREAAVIGTISSELPYGIKFILDPLRVHTNL